MSKEHWATVVQGREKLKELRAKKKKLLAEVNAEIEEARMVFDSKVGGCLEFNPFADLPLKWDAKVCGDSSFYLTTRVEPNNDDNLEHLKVLKALSKLVEDKKLNHHTMRVKPIVCRGYDDRFFNIDLRFVDNQYAIYYIKKWGLEVNFSEVNRMQAKCEDQLSHWKSIVERIAE